MSLDSINFSRATPLTEMYRKQLLEDYDYENSNDPVFGKISSYFKILKVQKINNAHLYGMYLLHKEEMGLNNTINDVREKILFHATSVANAQSIARNNINWRKTRRSRYGIGSCFSNCAKYANKYAGVRGAFIIAKVLVKNVESIGIRYSLQIPSTIDCDTTLGNGGYVYVKYDDNSFYPTYIVHYSYLTLPTPNVTFNDLKIQMSDYAFIVFTPEWAPEPAWNQCDCTTWYPTPCHCRV